MQRKLLYAALLPVLGLSLTAAAHATSISAGVYQVSPTTSVSDGTNTYYFSGSVTIGAGGLVTAASITLDDAAAGSPVFNDVTGTAASTGSSPVADEATITTASGKPYAQLQLYYLTTLDGSGDIDLCILKAKDCNSYQASNSALSFASSFGSNPVDLTGGTFDPGTTPTPTPEPSSIVLLGTGILGLAGAARRRFLKA